MTLTTQHLKPSELRLSDRAACMTQVPVGIKNIKWKTEASVLLHPIYFIHSRFGLVLVTGILSTNRLLGYGNSGQAPWRR